MYSSLRNLALSGLGSINQKSWFAYRHSVGEATIEAGGRNVRIPIGWGVGRVNLSYQNESLVEVIRALWKEGRRGEFVDVGANVGQSLLDLVRAGVSGVPYFGFEPQVSAARCVNEILRLNGLAGRVVCAALSNYSGTAEFHMSDVSDDLGASLAEGSLRSVSPQQRTTVAVLRGSDTIKGEPFLIKIDTEGGEPEVLEGLPDQLRAKTPIYFEVLGYRRYLSGDYDRDWTGGALERGQIQRIVEGCKSTSRRVETILRDYGYRIVDPVTREAVDNLEVTDESPDETNYLAIA